MSDAVGRVLAGAEAAAAVDVGTGFAFSRDLAMTAFHCIRGPDGEVTERAIWLRLGATSLPARVLRTEPHLDVALLRLVRSVPQGWTPLPVGIALEWLDDAPVRLEGFPADWPSKDAPMRLGGELRDSNTIIRAGVPALLVFSAEVAAGRDPQGYSGGPVRAEVYFRRDGVSRCGWVVVGIVRYAQPVEPDSERMGRGGQVFATRLDLGWPELEAHFVALEARRTGSQPSDSVAIDPQPQPPPVRRVSGLRVGLVDRVRDRDRQRAMLRGLLLGGPHRIVCVAGPRGVGKSALVAKVLAEFEAPDTSRGDGDLDVVVNLSTLRSGGFTLARVFAAVAALWPEPYQERLASRWQADGVDALADMWQQLDGMRSVIVLDNLDARQDPATLALVDDELVALLDSACRAVGCPKIVTTSQRPIELPSRLTPYVELLVVQEGLPLNDAIAVMRSDRRRPHGHLASTPDADLVRAARRVDARPRGLELLGGLIDRHKAFLREFLEGESTPEDVLLGLVTTSYEDRDDDSKLVAELLALAEAPFPEAAVPGVLDGLLAAANVEDALDELVYAGEINRRADVGMVELHPLDAEHIRNVLATTRPEHRAAIDCRLAAWWHAQRRPRSAWRTLDDTTSSQREYRHLWRAGKRAEALAVLADASRIIARYGESHVVAQVVALARTDSGPYDPVVDFHARRCEAMAAFFDGSLADAQVALREAQRLAKQDPTLTDELPQVEIDLAAVLRGQGDAAGAIATLQGVAFAPEDGRPTREQRQSALFELGLALLYEHRLDEALAATERLESMASVDDSTNRQATRANLRALASIVAEDYETALVAATEGIRLYKDSPYATNAGYMMNLRAVASLASNNVEAAVAEFRDAAAFAAAYRNDRLEGMCATNLAWALLRLRDTDGALDEASRAAQRLESNGVALAVSPRSLAAAISDSSGRNVEEIRASLEEASSLAEANPDIYRPTVAVLADVARALADA